jgi:hypothetical protein
MRVPQGQQKLPLGLTVLLPLLLAAQAGGWFWAETAKNSPQQYVHYHIQNVRRLVLLGSLLVHFSILHWSTMGPAIFHFYMKSLAEVNQAILAWSLFFNELTDY